MITFLLYFLSKPAGFSFLDNPWLYLAQLAGLFGAIVFSLTYLFSTRAKFLEKIFGGLDQVYHLHHYLGTAAFTILVSHPLFLVFSVLPDTHLAQQYLFFGTDFSSNLGVLALYCLFAVLVFTFIVKLPYHWWLNTHRLIGLPLFIALFHVILISSDVSRYWPLRLWVVSWLGVGLSSYLYREFIYPRTAINFVIDHIHPLGNITEIYLQGPTLSFLPGQFVFVNFLSQFMSSEFHPFSISSSPQDHLLRLSVKSLGGATSRYSQLTPGTTVKLHGPYGLFSRNFYGPNPVVCLAGGIGITPFLGMLAHERNHPSPRPITLIYCVSHQTEAVYHQELLNFQSKLPNLKYYLVDTSVSGHLTLNKIENYFDPSASYYLCGPEKFMKNISANLQTLGTKSKNIIFEDFSFL